MLMGGSRRARKCHHLTGFQPVAVVRDRKSLSETEPRSNQKGTTRESRCVETVRWQEIASLTLTKDVEIPSVLHIRKRFPVTYNLDQAYRKRKPTPCARVPQFG